MRDSMRHFGMEMPQGYISGAKVPPTLYCLVESCKTLHKKKIAQNPSQEEETSTRKIVPQNFCPWKVPSQFAPLFF